MEMNQLPEGKLGVLEGNRPELPFRQPSTADALCKASIPSAPAIGGEFAVRVQRQKRKST
jgi:hypothetical protein